MKKVFLFIVIIFALKPVGFTQNVIKNLLKVDTLFTLGVVDSIKEKPDLVTPYSYFGCRSYYRAGFFDGYYYLQLNSVGRDGNHYENSILKVKKDGTVETILISLSGSTRWEYEKWLKEGIKVIDKWNYWGIPDTIQSNGSEYKYLVEIWNNILSVTDEELDVLFLPKRYGKIWGIVGVEAYQDKLLERKWYSDGELMIHLSISKGIFFEKYPGLIDRLNDISSDIPSISPISDFKLVP